jgi:hypothetical protein
MSEDLTIQGDLAETTVPDLLRTLIRSREDGYVSLESDGRQTIIYFHEGGIVQASSSDQDLGLAELLLTGGELSLDQYLEAAESASATRQMTSIFREQAYVTAEDLAAASERQVAMILTDAVGLRNGLYTIDLSEGLTPEAAPPWNTDRLLLDAVRSITRWSLVSRGIGGPSRQLCQTDGADGRAFRLELSPEEAELLAQFEQPQTVMQICERSYLSHFDTCRIIWGLLTIDLLTDAGAAVESSGPSALENEYEIEEIVERYNSAYQRLFAIVLQEIGDHVYDFVDRVVMHVSPAVLPYLSGMTLINEGRVDVDQILTNLIASGSVDQKKAVHEVLNELFYGWLIEIRSEFGSRLEEQIAPVVESIRR